MPIVFLADFSIIKEKEYVYAKEVKNYAKSLRKGIAGFAGNL